MQTAIEYRAVRGDEIAPTLWADFSRRQVVTKCWRRVDGQWMIRDVAFIDDWSAQEYAEITEALGQTVQRGGFVFGAFVCGQLKGFVSVEPGLFGGAQGYLDLSCIQVSADWRGHGVGRTLFQAAKAWAKAHGARKLYISAHSAVESQAFYQAMGCVDAAQISRMHAQAEPFDRQMECAL